jgi:hypothetical protein
MNRVKMSLKEEGMAWADLSMALRCAARRACGSRNGLLFPLPTTSYPVSARARLGDVVGYFRDAPDIDVAHHGCLWLDHAKESGSGLFDGGGGLHAAHRQITQLDI